MLEIHILHFHHQLFCLLSFQWVWPRAQSRLVRECSFFGARATDGEEGGWRDGEGRASESVAERVAQGGLGWVLSLSHPSSGILDKLLRPSNPSVSAPGKRDTHLFGLTSASFLRGQ